MAKCFLFIPVSAPLWGIGDIVKVIEQWEATNV